MSVSARLELGVALQDVDPFLIHWSAYLAWMDRGHSAALASFGPLLRTWFSQGFALPTIGFRCRFRQRADIGDQLVLDTRLAFADAHRLGFTHRFETGEQAVVAEGETWLAAYRRRPAERVELSATLRDASAEPNGPAIHPPDVSRGTPPPRRTLERQVHLHESDSGWAHWLSFVRWMDDAASEMFAGLGAPMSQLHHEGYGFPLFHAEGAFELLPELDSQVSVAIWIERMGGTSLVLAYSFHSLEDGAFLGSARETRVHAQIEETLRPTPLPAWVRALST